MLKNYMEILIDEIFEEVKEMYGNCLTDSCIHDIKSMSLNILPPKYFEYSAHESEKKAYLLERQRRITVLAKIAESADLICSNCEKNTDKAI